MKRLIFFLAIALTANAQSIGPGCSGSLAGFPAPALPTPPPGATLFVDLQNNTGPGTPWHIDDTTTGSTGTGTCALAFGISSPSLSGSAMSTLNTTATTTHNCLATRKFGCSAYPGGVCTGVSNFETDFWVYFATGNTQNAYEFDPDLYGVNVDFFMSMQFRTHGGGSPQDGLYLYSKLLPGWINANNTPLFPLPDVTPGVWHHIQTYGTLDRTITGPFPHGSYTYIDFIYDGAYVYHNLNMTFGAGSTTSTGNTEVEMQADNDIAAGTTTEYFDNYNAAIW